MKSIRLSTLLEVAGFVLVLVGLALVDPFFLVAGAGLALVWAANIFEAAENSDEVRR